MKQTTLQILIACILLIIASSCKTRYKTQIVEVPKISIEYRDRLVKDSTVDFDSTFFGAVGDTIFKTKYISRTRFLTKVDSFLKVDTITTVAVKEVPVEVEKKLSWWQKFQINAFKVLSSIFLIALLIWIVPKLLRLFLRK